MRRDLTSKKINESTITCCSARGTVVGKFFVVDCYDRYHDSMIQGIKKDMKAEGSFFYASKTCAYLTSFGCHHSSLRALFSCFTSGVFTQLRSHCPLLDVRGVKYNHFELKNITFDKNKFPVLC